MGGGKRKRFDEKLTDATRALKYLDSAHATDGDELTSGALELVPFPGVRLRGEATDLPLPLTPDAANAIVQKATASKKTDEPRWEIQSQDVEVLNPRWRAFVNKIAGDVCEPLGISEAARVHATLSKLVLVRPGGRLPVDREEERVQRVVFGTLVVVLPGAFTGGATSVRRDGEPVRPPLQWQPGHADRPVYDVTYAAFYNNSTVIETLPITSGEALCLVYDLVTTTIHEVPRAASLPVLHQALEASLTQFFELLPSHKRFKLSDDAWRTINEFAVDRRFVYPVTGDSFESLQGDDQRIAERLAAFCEHSNRQYVMYLAALSCTRQSYTRDDSILDPTCAVALHPPWFKHGEARELPFPVMIVKHRVELAPAGFLEALPYQEQDDSDDGSSSSRGSFSSRSRDDRGSSNWRMQHHNGHALVVQPATLEHALWAKAPIPDAIEKLRELVAASPEEAVRFARRLLSSQHLHRWTNMSDTFKQLLDIAVALDAAPLFHDMLRTVAKFEFEDHAVSRGVRHFGWDSCVATIEHILQTHPLFDSRVNFVCSVLHDCTNVDHIDRLVLKLAKRVPWIGYRANEYADHAYHAYYKSTNPTVDQLTRLLALAHGSSPATLLKLIGQPNAGNMTVHLVIPSLVRFTEALATADRAPLIPLLRSVRATIEASLPVLRNAHYAQNIISEYHCVKCQELRYFLASTEVEISLKVTSKTQLKHIETVIKRKVNNDGPVTVSSPDPNTVQLTKLVLGNVFSETAEQAIASLQALIP